MSMVVLWWIFVWMAGVFVVGTMIWLYNALVLASGQERDEERAPSASPRRLPQPYPSPAAVLVNGPDARHSAIANPSPTAPNGDLTARAANWTTADSVFVPVRSHISIVATAISVRRVSIVDWQ
jgi:hypothetical protein